MTVIEAIEHAESAYDIRSFCTDDDALGPCPCFSIDQPGFRAEGRCWRTSFHGFSNWSKDFRACRHDGCCLHVKTDTPEAAQRLKSLLDEMDWYGEWDLEVEA